MNECKGQECPFSLCFALFQVAGDPADVVGAGGEVGVGDDFLLEGNGRLDAADHELAEGALHAGDGDLAGGSGDDELGDHGVVVRRDGVAGIDVGIDADAFSAGGVPEVDGAGAGGEIVEGVLGIDAALDGVAAGGGFEHVVGERLAGGDADLLLDELAAHDFLGDRVLDLDPGVHFHEIEVLGGFVDEVFDGAGVLIADVFDEIDGRLAHAGAELGGEQRRRAFLDDFLIPALHGAVALAEVDEISVGIADDLELDVVGIEDEFFEVTIAIAEAGDGFVRRGLEEADEFLFLETRTHAAATTAGGGLDHDGEADFFRLDEGGFRVGHDAGAGGDGDAVGDGGGAGGGLVAHHGNDGGGRANEGDAGAGANFREAGVFRKEAVAGVDGIRAGDLGSGDDAVDLKVGLLAGGGADADGFVGELDVHGIDVGLGVDGDGFDIQLAAGADDAEGDFAAIGDQDAFEHEEDLGLGIVDRRSLFNAEEHVAVLDGGAVFGDEGADGAGFFGFDLVHDFHGLDDAERLADGDGGADFDEIRGVRGGLHVEGADHG